MLLGLGRAGQLALQPLHQLARLLEVRAVALALLARLVGLCAQLVEHALRVLEPAAELDDPLGSLGQVAAGDRGLLAGLLKLSGGALQRALELVRAAQRRLDGIRDLPGRGGGRAARVVVFLVRRERRLRRLDQRAEGDDRAGGEVLVLEVRLAAHRGVDPVHDRAVAALELPQRVAARGGDLERLEEAVELEALAHPHRDERERQLELGAVLAPRDGLDDSAVLGEVAGHGQRLDQRAPEHALSRPAEQLLGGAAPAGDGAVPVREHEAGIDELAQQLFDGLRLGGRGTRLVLGHLPVPVGAREGRHKP